PTTAAEELAPAAAVVEQRINGQLQGEAVLAKDGLRGVIVQRLPPLRVAAEYALLEGIQLAGRLPAAVEADGGAQGRRPRRPDAAGAEGLDDFEPAQGVFLAGRLAGQQAFAELGGQSVQVEPFESHEQGLGSGGDDELAGVAALKLLIRQAVEDAALADLA